MPRFPYQFFDSIVIRKPLLSYKDFQNTFSSESTNDEKLQKILTDNTFGEAIFLASPSLHQQIEKFLSDESDFSKEQQHKLKNTILKYYTRASTRSTPFGLFSGVGLVSFIKCNELKAQNQQLSTKNQLRDTKLDMHFLVSLSQYLISIQFIKHQILFSPNNSIYNIGDKIRYIEYENNRGKRDYIISSAPFSEELQKVIDFSNFGKTISEITKILINSAITLEDATEFIDELIENQVLVSELEPNVAGVDFLDSIISILNRIEANEEKDRLISIQKKLGELDKNMGNPVSKYKEIEELIKSLGVDYDQKYLFQIDLYLNHEPTLPYHWKKELKQGISFLNKITCIDHKATHLEKFKKAFFERFENEEVSLSFALDTEVGIGYWQDFQTKGVHPYLEDLTLPGSKEKKGLEIKLNPIQLILNQKLQNALLKKENTIQLSDEDFEDFEENWSDLPKTMAFTTEIVSENNQEKLFLNGGNGNAGRLLGRFCSNKSEIQNLTKMIAKKEELLNFDRILAEIVHLPESRIGNILRRPEIRNYEIPYLAKSLLPDDYQIPVDDLYISIKNDRIILRSQKHDKEIIPYLTNAHNYSANSLPVYHFLCDFSSQNIRSGLHFDWGDLSRIYDFLPRVEYENTILSKAQWKMSSIEIKKFSLLLDNKQQLSEEIKNWRNNRQIPQWIQWVQYDNTLVVNLENKDLLCMFLSSIKNEVIIVIQEFLYNELDNFTRQFIFPMFKDNKG